MRTVVMWLLMGVSSTVWAAGTPKEVCRVEKDKQGKEKKVCKTILVHKKLEGTKVPAPDKK